MKNTITFVYSYDIHYEDNNVGGETFDQTFDDSCLYNYYGGPDPDKDVARMVEADFEEMGPAGLAQYIGDYEGELQNCVESIVGKFDVNESHLEMKCVLKDGVDPQKEITYVNNSKKTVLEALKDYIRGQLSDGWGEGFEQQPIPVGTVYAVYNENSDYDCDWFADERSAIDDCDSKNDLSEYEDDEDFDENDYDHYDWIQDDITAYYSFWSSKFDTLDEIYINGYDAEGYDDKGYNKEGYDRYGRNTKGYDKEGYDRSGYDEEGYDKEGFNREGKDKGGYNRSGKKMMRDSRPTDRSGNTAGAMFSKDKSGKVTIANPYESLYNSCRQIKSSPNYNESELCPRDAYNKRQREINRENDATLAYGEIDDAMSAEFVKDSFFKKVPGSHHWSESVGNLTFVCSIDEDDYGRAKFMTFRNYKEVDSAREFVYLNGDCVEQFYEYISDWV